MIVSQQKSKDKILGKGMELVMFRNAFYRDQYRQACIAFIILLIINALLVFGITYKALQPPVVRYFAVAPDGRMINSRALSDPSVSDSYVLQWVADKVRASFSQDFIHYRGQLQSVADAYTPNGWNDFYQSMEKSNNLKTLVSKQMVSTVKITTPPVMEQKTVVNGHYAWKVKMSIMVSFVNENKTINMPFEVTVIVIREPVEKFPDRIAINNFLPVLQKTAGSQLLNI